MAAKLAKSKKRPSIKRDVIKIASLGIAGLIAGLLTGCSSTVESIAPTAYPLVSGNWQFSSTNTASILPVLAGNLAINGSQITGTLHPLASGVSVSGSINAQAVTPHTLCTSSADSFPVTGNVGLDGKTTLTSTGFSGGTVTITGTLSSSQNSLTNATYGVTNGTCATPSAQAIVGKYETLSGTYSGTIYSVTGTSLYVSTIFTQTTSPDANGTYHLQGNSTFGSLQPCLPTPPTVSDSTVTGSTLTATYTESPSGTPITVVVDATFSPDAATLTLNNYQITGGYCDGDSGHGTLIRQ